MFDQRKTGGRAAEAKHAWTFCLDNKTDLGFVQIRVSVKSFIRFYPFIQKQRTDEHAGEAQKDHLISPNNPELFLLLIMRQTNQSCAVIRVFLPELLEFFQGWMKVGVYLCSALNPFHLRRERII